MKRYTKYCLLALVAVLALSLVVCGNLGAPAQAVKPPTKTPLPPTSTPEPWVLTWSDEFDGPDLDQSLWFVYENPSPRNNEENYYTHEDVYIEDGKLVIRQQLRDFGSGNLLRHYTSGQVISRLDVGPRTGRVEIRGKPSTETGFHTAYWTYDTVHWPPEIDILEVVGQQPGTDYMCFHWDTWPNNDKVCDSWVDPAGDLDLNYHVYAMEYDFDLGYIRWTVDGVERFYVTDNLYQLETMPLKVLLDTAIGGDWEGDPDGSTIWPGYNIIDYVRVYQRGGSPITPTPVTATPFPTETPIPPPSATPSNDPLLNRVAAAASSDQANAGLAIDGNMTTAWTGGMDYPEWIYVDLGAPKWISRVKLHWDYSFAMWYDLQVSDNAADWTTVRSLGLQDGGEDDLTGIDTLARYVRVSATDTWPYGPFLFEFEVYGADATPEPSPTPTDGPSPTPSNTPIPPTATSTPPPGPSMHVDDITLTYQTLGKNYQAIATVTIVDAVGAPVEGATVDVTWTGAGGTATRTDPTDENGEVRFWSTRGPAGTYNICVTNVTKTGVTYDAAANVETCDSITVP